MKIFAQVISWLFLPLFIPIYALALAMFVPANQDFFFNLDCMYTMTVTQKWSLIYVFFLFLTALPGVSYIMLYRTRYISSLEIENREERFVPIILMAVYCISLYFLILYKVGAGSISKFALALPLSGFIVSIVSLFLNKWKKISLHTGAAGMLLGFILAYAMQHAFYEFWIIIVAVLICGLVMSARMFLGKHSLTESLLGWLAGTLITFVVNFYY